MAVSANADSSSKVRRRRGTGSRNGERKGLDVSGAEFDNFSQLPLSKWGRKVHQDSNYFNNF